MPPECRPNAEGASTAVSGSRILRHSRYFRQRALWSLEIVPPIGWVSWRIRTVTLVALPESPHRGAGARPGGEPGGRDGRCWPPPFGLGSTMHRAGTRRSRATDRYHITIVRYCQALRSIPVSRLLRLRRGLYLAGRAADHTIVC